MSITILRTKVLFNIAKKTTQFSTNVLMQINYWQDIIF